MAEPAKGTQAVERAAALVATAVRADEPRLPEADRGHVEQEPDVARDAEAARVRRAHAVERDDVGADGELLPDLDERGRLAEREQARQVRERRARRDAGPLDDLEVGQADRDDARVDDVGVLVAGCVGKSGRVPGRAAPAFEVSGIGFAFASLANLIVEAVPRDQTGVASGMNTIVRTIGGAVGAQVAVSILATHMLADGHPIDVCFEDYR